MLTFAAAGITKLVLKEFENWAKELKTTFMVLETGARQVEALSLYPKAGYMPIPKYGPYIAFRIVSALRKYYEL